MAYLEIGLYWGLPCLGLLLLVVGLGTLFKGDAAKTTHQPVPVMASEKNLRAGDAGEAEVDAVLATMNGLERLPHFSFELRAKDGAPAFCQIDHLVRGCDRLWIVETKNWAGTVLRTISDNQNWLVRSPAGNVDSRYNPVDQSRKQAARLSAVTGVPVSPLVCMAGTAVHADEKWPFGVVSISGLANLLGGLARNQGKDSKGVSSAEVAQGWRKAMELATLDGDGSVSRLQAVYAATQRAMKTAPPMVETKKGEPTAGMLLAALLCGTAWWYLPAFVNWVSPPPQPVLPMALPQVEAPLPIPPVPPMPPVPSARPSQTRAKPHVPAQH